MLSYNSVYGLLKDFSVDFLTFNDEKEDNKSFVCRVDVFEKKILSWDGPSFSVYRNVLVMGSDEIQMLMIGCNPRLFVIFDWVPGEDFYEWRCRGKLYETEEEALKELDK